MNDDENNKQYYTLGVAKQKTKAAPAPVNAHVKIVPRSAWIIGNWSRIII